MQNTAYAHILLKMANVAIEPLSRLTRSRASLFWPVLSRGSRFNIRKTWALDGKVRASKDRCLEVPELGIAGRGSRKDEIFVGGCGRTRGY